MKVTKHGQTQMEVAKEFMAAVLSAPENPELEAMASAIVAEEATGRVPQRIYDSITRIQGHFDVYTLPLIQNTKMNVSPYLLAYLAPASAAIPAYFTTVLGCYATIFYSKRPKTDQLTLKWVHELVGAKILSSKDIFPWNMACKDEEGKNIFDTVTPEDIFTYTNN